MKAFLYTCLITLHITFIVMLASCQAEINKPGNTTALPRAYYINNNGNDNNEGSYQHPWKNISRIKDLPLIAGDTILLQAGQTFSGTLIISYHTKGTAEKPVVITSYGNGIAAAIYSGNEAGVIVNNGEYIQLRNIKVSGAGRKYGNTKSGVTIAYCNNITIDSLEVTGYQKSGVLLRNCSNITVQHVHAHENGYAGIAVDGETFSKTDSRNIQILHCRVENNPGDPTNLSNHSGNGIVVSQCTNLKIAYCTATNNGWDMPRIGNGPVGIWAWDADSVIIEHCLSYRNKTSPGGQDGGGFDFDGGVTNSIIQYCLSYQNEGSGIGLFQYNAAKPWGNNTIRYNVSINDGNVSAAKAGMYIWSASATYYLKNCFIYNNTIYNDKNAAISFAPVSTNEGFVFYNNILVGKKEIISGNNITGKYLGNCWWSLDDGFNVNQITNFTDWTTQKHQEVWNGNVAGINGDPGFANMDNIMVTSAEMLSTFLSVQAANPGLVNGGMDMHQLFGITTGGKDFNGNTAPVKGIGASF